MLRSAAFSGRMAFNLFYNSNEFFLQEDCHYSTMRVTRVSFLFWGLLLLSACLPFNASAPTASPLPIDTAVPTEPIVWFPPSATPTRLAFPTQTGTPEM